MLQAQEGALFYTEHSFLLKSNKLLRVGWLLLVYNIYGKKPFRIFSLVTLQY